MFLYKLYPFAWAGKCAIGKESMCGEYICALRGEWHIAWQLPLNGIGTEFLLSNPITAYLSFHEWTYFLLSFMLPFAYGSWRGVLLSYLMGPFLAGLLTRNVNEIPAIWCLFSIFLCLTVIKSPLKKHLYVKRWTFYPKN